MRWQTNRGVRWIEADLPGARAFFSTRIGGASAGPFDSLNLGLLTDDDAGSVMSNRRTLMDCVEIDDGRVLSGRQVHGAELLVSVKPLVPSPWVDGADGDPADVDGHVTSNPELAPLVFVADCLPVAMAGPDGVAMLHCGWRGLAAGIVAKGAKQIAARSAVIGPGIGPCCFEVGPEVSAEFAHLGEGLADGRMLDLPEVCERLLRAAGVVEVERIGLCTYCEEDLFFSHRRDGGVTGRQSGLVRSWPS